MSKNLLLPEFNKRVDEVIEDFSYIPEKDLAYLIDSVEEEPCTDEFLSSLKYFCKSYCRKKSVT